MYVPKFLLILPLVTVIGGISWMHAQPRASVLAAQELYEIEQYT